jgi:dinuclear metal center YbgI/SA1388 family protein
VDEAIALRAELIIAHHAIIYRPIKDLRTDTSAGRVYEKCLKHDIAVYISHTNLDVAPGGINDMMADMLDLRSRTYLKEVYEDTLYKLVVYVPEENKDAVIQAMFASGAGSIGDYSHCSFQTSGMGTFLPGEGTEPFIGTVGKLERVQEAKIETIVPESRLKKTVAAMIKAHPYEEPAYDVFPMKQPGVKHGLGRVGVLPEPLQASVLCEKVKRKFDVPMLRFVGDPSSLVRKVAVLGGAGGKYVKAAQYAGADVLVTGDIEYHTAQDALADGMMLIDPGHNIEKIMKQGVVDVLNREFASKKITVHAMASKVDTEPFRFM